MSCPAAVAFGGARRIDRDGHAPVDLPARHHLVRDTAILTALALLLATVFFAGYGLGDDAAYTQMSAQILDHGYPAAHGTDVFASRPVLLYSIAASLALFSWSELAYVLPVIACGIASLLSVYFIASCLAGRGAGWMASAALALSPLHLAFTTTLCNDIVGAGLVGSSVVLILASRRFETPVWAAAIACVGGVLAAGSLGVKLSFGLLLIPVIAALAVSGLFGADRRWWRIGAAACTGFFVGLLALLIFFWLTAGDPFAGVRVELAFNRAYMLPVGESQHLRHVLAFYPRIASGLLVSGPPDNQWSPAGLLFPLAAVSAFDALRHRHRQATIVAAPVPGCSCSSNSGRCNSFRNTYRFTGCRVFSTRWHCRPP